jgi:catechol 2,3-dioxygenase-like lactoylglutathione lyase family enzyme
MLDTADVQPTIGVTDLDKASQFYGDLLGLSIDKADSHEIVYHSGSGQLSVYKTDRAGTNKATYATWEVDDIEDAAQALGKAGVSFEHYDDMPGITRDGDIHTMGDEKAAWFTDPDGNILCLHAAI